MTLFDGLSFGWRTALLSLAIGQMLIIAAALLRPIANRSANRTLALLLLVLAGICTPWAIGFAGFYDKWRWLSFLPVSITLAVAPLLWFYVHALTSGRWPLRAQWHIAPAAAQFAFLFCSFLLPMPLKDSWLEQAGPVVDVVTSTVTLIGLGAYGWASLSLLRDYRHRLDQQRADDHRYAARWLVAVIAAMIALLPLWAAFVLTDWLVMPLGYTGLMGLYIVIAAFALFIGIEGWRHAALRFPSLAELDPLIMTEASGAGTTRDWAQQGRAWAAQIEHAAWDSDPEVNLSSLAQRLGTNSAYLSRALNDGLGTSFPALINTLRARRVAAMIDAGRTDDLLDLALEAGFNSKASFNRAFRDTLGTTPSAYRAARR